MSILKQRVELVMANGVWNLGWHTGYWGREGQMTGLCMKHTWKLWICHKNKY